KLAHRPQDGQHFLCCPIALDNHNQRRSSCRSKQWKMQRFGGSCESRDTPPSRTALQVGGRTLENRGLLKFRKQLSDKRQDHGYTVILPVAVWMVDFGIS